MARKTLKRGPVAKRLGIIKGDKLTVKPVGRKPKLKIVGSGKTARVEVKRTVEVTLSRPVGKRFGKTRRAKFN